jgi:soluble lytic murein transglycosylase-like protein
MSTTLYRAHIQGAAHEHGLDPDLVEAVVYCESAGKTDAFRYEPGFYERYIKGKKMWEGCNPRRISSSYGLKHLSLLVEWAGMDALKALAAYNGGKGNWMGNDPQVYSKKVYRVFQEVQKLRAK